MGEKGWKVLCAGAVPSCVPDLTLQSRWELNSRGKRSHESRKGRPEGNKFCCLQTLLRVPFPQHISALRVSSESSLRGAASPVLLLVVSLQGTTSCTLQNCQGKKYCQQGQRLFLPSSHRRNSPELKSITQIKARNPQDTHCYSFE